MSQALYTSMTGIKAPQTQLEVVSNNIANINTTGYKAANVTFEDIFSTTYTAGNAPTVTAGGVNPKQVGLGVQVEGISRNFGDGTYVATGRTDDLMISGNGFFTVMDSDGTQYFTRDGNFTLDANGDMVNSAGYKLIGASQLYSTTGSEETVHVPTSFTAEVTANADVGNKKLNEINCGQSITDGKFTINVTTTTGATTTTTPVEITVDDTNNANVSSLTASIQQQLADAGFKDVDGNPLITIDLTSNDGCITAKTSGSVTGLEFSSNGATSNFVKATQMAKDSAGNYTSQVLDYNVDVQPVTSYDDTAALSSHTIGTDGVIQATYSNGAKLTVDIDPNTYKFDFKYTTNTGVEIKGDNVTVNELLAKPENFVIEIGTVVNPEGLVAQGGNLWQIGPNCGATTYSVASNMGLGSLQTGGLEASNVDLAQEFSNMILAQRAIQANSRVFNTASSVLEQLSYLGQ